MRNQASPLYLDYIEGMLADYTETTQALRDQGCSDIEILIGVFPADLMRRWELYNLRLIDI
ncbi:MAG: hypothetical protein HC881_06990 [Leptolyngbyaceae cyanobacterium SL_7_1]|nr:hypothetical protein [Leptolyngbyaceae cyanobacterium SL_7_1]